MKEILHVKHVETIIQTEAKVVSTNEEKKDISLSFVRNVVRGKWSAAKHCLVRYPYLQLVLGVPEHLEDILSHPSFELVKIHILELVTQEMPEFSAPSLDEPEHISQKKYQNQMKQLKKLVPGSSAALTHLQDQNGTVFSDAASHAKILNSHWKQVFSKKAINKQLLKTWISEHTNTFAKDTSWAFLESHVSDAIKYATHSAPGPDGIPYAAFKSTLELSTSILYNVGMAMLAGVAPPDHSNFNSALLVCLPKKPVRTDSVLGDIFGASQVSD